MKTLNDFHKMAETSVDPRLQLCLKANTLDTGGWGDGWKG